MHPAPSSGLGTALAAAFVAALVGWAAVEAAHETFQVPIAIRGDLAKSAEQARESRAANIKNATLAMALLGGTIAASLGLLGRRSRESGSRSGLGLGLVAVFAGLCAGAGCGGVAAALLAPIVERNLLLASDSLVLPILIHGTLAVAVGAAGGLAFGLGKAQPPRGTLNGILGGALGALLGSAVYVVLGAIAFPTADTARLISATTPARLIACSLLTFSTVVGVHLSTRAASPCEAPRDDYTVV